MVPLGPHHSCPLTLYLVDAVQWVQSVSMAASVGLLKALAISRYDWPSAELKEVQALIAPLCSHSIRGDIDKLLTDVAAGEHGDEAKQTLLAFKTLGTDISSSWFHIAYFQFVLRVTAVKALVHHASGHVEDKTTFRADWIHGRKTHQIVAQTSINARSQRLWNMVISNFGSAKNAAEHTLVVRRRHRRISRILTEPSRTGMWTSPTGSPFWTTHSSRSRPPSRATMPIWTSTMRTKVTLPTRRPLPFWRLPPKSLP